MPFHNFITFAIGDIIKKCYECLNFLCVAPHHGSPDVVGSESFLFAWPVVSLSQFHRCAGFHVVDHPWHLLGNLVFSLLFQLSIAFLFISKVLNMGKQQVPQPEMRPCYRGVLSKWDFFIKMRIVKSPPSLDLEESYFSKRSLFFSENNFLFYHLKL